MRRAYLFFSIVVLSCIFFEFSFADERLNAFFNLGQGLKLETPSNKISPTSYLGELLKQIQNNQGPANISVPTSNNSLLNDLFKRYITPTSIQSSFLDTSQRPKFEKSQSPVETGVLSSFDTGLSPTIPVEVPKVITPPAPTTISPTPPRASVDQAALDAKDPTQIQNLTPDFIKKNPYTWIQGKGTLMYGCGQKVTDKREIPACAASYFGYDAFNCNDFCGVGMSKYLMQGLFAPEQLGKGDVADGTLKNKTQNRLIEISRKDGSFCNVVPVVDAGSSAKIKKFQHIQNGSAVDLSWCLMVRMGVENPNKTGTLKDIKFRALPADGSGGCQKPSQADIEKMKPKIKPGQPTSGCSYCIATPNGGQCG